MFDRLGRLASASHLLGNRISRRLDEIRRRPGRHKVVLRQSSILSSRLTIEAIEPRLLLSGDLASPLGAALDSGASAISQPLRIAPERPVILTATPAESAPAAALVDPQTGLGTQVRSEEHTSELQSLMRISYA